MTWTRTWQEINKILPEVELPMFRSCSTIVSRLVDNSGKYALWKDACIKAGLQPEDYRDSLIGNPTDVKHFSNVATTVNSLRFAYYIYRIGTELQPSGTIKVLEVGGGYGGFAEQLCRKFDVSKYYLLDAPPLVELQRYFLTEAGLGEKIRFEEPDEEVDLIVSTNTLGEMPQEDVRRFVLLFERVLRPVSGLMFLVQRKKKGAHILTAWDEYPFSPAWELDVKPHIRNRKTQIECFGRLKAA